MLASHITVSCFNQTIILLVPQTRYLGYLPKYFNTIWNLCFECVSTCVYLCFVYLSFKCVSTRPSWHLCVVCVHSDVTEITQETNSPFSLIGKVVVLTKRKYIQANKPQILSQYGYTPLLHKLLSQNTHKADAALKATSLSNDSIEWSI